MSTKMGDTLYTFPAGTSVVFDGSATFNAAQVGQEVAVTITGIPLLGAGSVQRVVSPCAGTIVKIWSVLNGEAIATGNATLTGKIGSTAITNGVLTIAVADSAVGDIDSATPTAANTVVAGSDINFSLGGTNTAEDAKVTVTVVIKRSA